MCVMHFRQTIFALMDFVHLVGRRARSRGHLLRRESDWKKYLRFFSAKFGEPRKSNFLNLRVHMSGPCKFSRFESDWATGSTPGGAQSGSRFCSRVFRGSPKVIYRGGVILLFCRSFCPRDFQFPAGCGLFSREWGGLKLDGGLATCKAVEIGLSWMVGFATIRQQNVIHMVISWLNGTYRYAISFRLSFLYGFNSTPQELFFVKKTK